MDMERMAARYARAKRHTTARSVFDWIALVCLISSTAFWLTLHWAWLSPAHLLSMQSIVAVVMGLIYSLVTPLLWSAMAPSTPAGMMLQRTQTRTWGFVVMLGATGFLTWHGWRLIWSWWMAQPNVSETGEAAPLAIACLIGFVVVPALAWTATTPEQWMAAVEQAHQVKKLELQQKGELAIIKASLIRAETLAAIGWANLLPLEKEEAIGSLRGLLMGSADSMRAVVKTLGLDANLTRSILDDEEIAAQLDYVTRSIDVVPEIAPPQLPAAQQPSARAPHQEAVPDRGGVGWGGAGNAPPPQSAAVGGSQPQYAAEYQAARQRLTGVWSSTDLGEVIGKSPRTALDRIYAWIEAGLVKRDLDGKGAYYFTEREVR